MGGCTISRNRLNIYPGEAGIKVRRVKYSLMGKFKGIDINLRN